MWEGDEAKRPCLRNSQIRDNLAQNWTEGRARKSEETFPS